MTRKHSSESLDIKALFFREGNSRIRSQERFSGNRPEGPYRPGVHTVKRARYPSVRVPTFSMSSGFIVFTMARISVLGK